MAQLTETVSTPESVFTWGGPPLKFGPGAADEIGHDLGPLGVRRALLLTDPGVAATGVPARVAETMRTAGLEVEVYDAVHVEPTDESLRSAVAYARAGDWDGFVAVGGGSSIDTAKAVNLLTTHPGDLMDYVNKPLGEGKAPTGPLRPLVAVPTTAGTGAESTPVCIMDILGLHLKSGISHPRLRPSLAVVDPVLTLTLPREVTAAAGMDVLCHALESYTAKPYDAYAHKTPDARVPYCGANPIADVWSERALTLLSGAFRRAVHQGDDLGARTDMMLAATFAGLGFGNAGVHIPHACGYPIAGMVRGYRPPGYPDAPLVPHGQSVSVTAPEAFRFTYAAVPDRHVRAAGLLDPDVTARVADPCEALPSALVSLMRDIGVPSGIAEVGYGEADVPALVEGAMKQQRLLDVSPVPVRPEDLDGILRRSLHNWG
ncbi:MAG: hydroxyacid-oxoacid transhydrogenase [Actinomycetes bacterium]